MNLSYKNAGVDISLADQWVEVIKGISKSMPANKDILGGIGGFSGLYRLPGGMALAGCCDGVGTKIEVARAAGMFTHIGQDLVAMNVNDLITCGARPLFFIDYIACGKLNIPVLKPIVESVAKACGECGCALLGGETAEMPGVYPEDGLDLAGFAVGIVEEEKIIDGKSVAAGDVIVGIPSSGVHSNGFSLVRRVLFSEGSKYSLHKAMPRFEGATLAEMLLAPTKLYVNTALGAVSTGKVKAMAHITGGGLVDNLRRVVPDGLGLSLDYTSWPRPAIFSLLSEEGVEEEEMRRVFNLGIGYCLIVAQEDVPLILGLIESQGERGMIIGEVVA